MKTCPSCNQTYTDETLNFCLNDGTTLVSKDSEPPPTIFMDPPRTTNPNYAEHSSPFGQQDQQIYQAPYSPPAFNQSQDQTLPIVSLVLGVMCFLIVCCYGASIPLGIGALITGYMGMRNADQNPQKYGGRGMAIGGLVLGGMGVAGGLIYVLLIILGLMAG
ncbi:hypothetical protein BH20ACI4_BH20ACI4_00790 [soil metagenome]